MESTKFEIPFTLLLQSLSQIRSNYSFNLRPSFNLEIQAAKLRWSALFDSVDSTTGDWIAEQMITVRPVVETGYETLLLVRLLLETRVPSIRKSSV
ncbi:ribosomal RNA small subunit methyltransferase G [Trifolium repens]|nr:ribosomal RNA small subunit methyltransferase G [Trifolium repens]